MRSYVTLYIPTQYTEILDSAKLGFAQIAGGSTTTLATGNWLDSDEVEHVDDIALVKAFVADDVLKALTLFSRYIAKQLFAVGEDSVAIEINGELTLEDNPINSAGIAWAKEAKARFEAANECGEWEDLTDGR